MAPFGKENEILTVPSATDSRLEDTSARPQPVALEVPVTVNGARTVEGSDKREPFSETTKTVLVFGHGAVIRLGSPVAAGQLLFLTNEKTKKEVVCQVVKSKNYRNVSGYVELEFTESVVGFWGMRFPSDRIAAHAPVPSAVAPAPIKSLPAAPVAPARLSPPVSSAPEAPEISAAQVPAQVTVALPAAPKREERPSHTTAFSSTPSSTTPEIPAAPVPSVSVTLASSVVSMLSAPEPQPVSHSSKPPASPIPSESKPAPVSVAAENSTEELKLQAARLQEQLSSLLFDASSSAKPAVKEPVADSSVVPAVAPKVFEMAKSDSVPAKPVLATRNLPPPIKSSLDTEEVKIPSWLEPLARNAAALTQEPLEREKTKHAAEIVAYEESSVGLLDTAETVSGTEPQMPAIGSLLPLDEDTARHQRPSGGSHMGILLGTIAAGLLLAVGGGWYLYHPTNALKGASTPVRSSSGDTASSSISSASASQPIARDSAAIPEASPRSNETPRSNVPVSSEPFTKLPTNPQPAPVRRESTRDSAAAIPAAITERISRPAPEPEIKKPALGEVHLASPTVNHAEISQDGQVVAPTLSAGTSNANSDGFASGLTPGSGKQPSAPEIPLPVGGDVKPAKLISEVPPSYPIMAKNQRVTGDVVIDALIDVNGRVTATRVISGPALLHQAAKDALRQWKYQPASLDGKPVAMHLTVTLQFRMP